MPAPIVDTLAAYARAGYFPFHTPGHKYGPFAPQSLRAVLGDAAWGLDLPSMTATDSLLHPTRCIADAERLAAQLFGAADTYFLAGGSTQAVAGMLLAAVPPGGVVLLPRNVHRSVVGGLVLSGARPRFLRHDVLAESGALGVSEASLRAGLDAHPDAAAVLLTRPSYYGLAVDLEPARRLTRERGVKLLVDEAHGAHLRFCPNSEGRPTAALDYGADLVAQSWHKTLGALGGAAVLHRGQGSAVPAARVRATLNLLHSTSASLLLLASLDAARLTLAEQGEALFADAVAQARRLAERINQLPGLRVLAAGEHPELARHQIDPLRMTINVAGAGWTGYEAELLLRSDAYRIEDEMSDPFSIVLVLGPGDPEEARQRLLAGLAHIAENPKPVRDGEAFTADMLQPPLPPQAATPREAALAEQETVSFPAAVGRTCAETIAFYPPGIPLVMPGETITAPLVSIAQRLLSAGAYPHALDSSLQTVSVVA
ncbi:Arginine decarboxylase [Pirellulimonas nuda]|uniref:Arginine decarboxylase n=1 Tax=Pirellulimonas nuda TaxID=2528009 RepID=A0A518DIU3_9BACT|nr:aminotransferase class I/II-fold pyridoxal phosphate-dependent enzyme [Pirellulimonas nuda]QDU91388.1 Arginine decarboxylase [Pirellulimonas nuda]